MKKTYVLRGNFGSGKTEISLNMAVESAKTKKTVLVDLDIINPYFRSTERRDMLAQHGIKLHSPVFAMTGVEVPSLPPDIYSVFIDDCETVIFDVGGDPAGAVALGQYKRNFDSLGHLEVLYVINAMRPFSSELALNLDMLEKIAFRSRLAITGLVNNTNLSNQSSANELLNGYDMVKSVSQAVNIPVKYTAGTPEVIEAFDAEARERKLEKEFIGEYMPIARYMHRDWERFTESGI